MIDRQSCNVTIGSTRMAGEFHAAANDEAQHIARLGADRHADSPYEVGGPGT